MYSYSESGSTPLSDLGESATLPRRVHLWFTAVEPSRNPIAVIIKDGYGSRAGQWRWGTQTDDLDSPPSHPARPQVFLVLFHFHPRTDRRTIPFLIRSPPASPSFAVWLVGGRKRCNCCGLHGDTLVLEEDTAKSGLLMKKGAEQHGTVANKSMTCLPPRLTCCGIEYYCNDIATWLAHALLLFHQISDSLHTISM